MTVLILHNVPEQNVNLLPCIANAWRLSREEDANKHVLSESHTPATSEESEQLSTQPLQTIRRLTKYLYLSFDNAAIHPAPRGQDQRSVHERQWGENDRWGPGGPHRTGSPYGIRTRAATLRGWCPRPLDERAVLRAEGYRDPPLNSHASATTRCAGPRAGTSSMVGVRGLEPRITEPESAVLPITPHPIGRADCTGEPTGGHTPQPRPLNRSKPTTRPRATPPASTRCRRADVHPPTTDVGVVDTATSVNPASSAIRRLRRP